MAVANLVNDPTQIVTGGENLAIVQIITTKRGGATLNVAGYTPTTIQGGHLIIEETATKELKPMPLNGGGTAYAALPADHTYFGYNIATIPTSKPFSGILLRGTVNPKACPFVMDSILAAVKAAIPHILHSAD